MASTGEPDDGETRLALLRLLEREFAEKQGILAAIRELITEVEADTAPTRHTISERVDDERSSPSRDRRPR
jgi:hypothetical protein